MDGAREGFFFVGCIELLVGFLEYTDFHCTHRSASDIHDSQLWFPASREMRSTLGVQPSGSAAAISAVEAS